MIIGIDARFAVHNRRGIGNYTLKLIHNLAEIDDDNQYILYTDRGDAEGILPRRTNFLTRKLTWANYLLWEQILLPLYAKKDKVDILHCTGSTAPMLLDKRIKLITTIHDVMFLKDYSELSKSVSLYQRMGRLYRKTIVPRTAKRLSMVLTVSEFSKNDIMKHIPDLEDGRVKVTYEAANESYRPVDNTLALQKVSDITGIGGGYILALGALDPRKNTDLLIKTFIELKNEAGIQEKLVIIGVPNWKQTKFYDTVQKSNFKDDIIFTDFISEDDLVFLYNGAVVFVYPSSYEGFGIPPLEAMACGVPVITSNRTSIPEVVGDAALLVNPTSGKELRAALLRVLSDHNARKELVESGFRRASQFSWLKMARETREIYETVGNEITGAGNQT